MIARVSSRQLFQSVNCCRLAPEIADVRIGNLGSGWGKPILDLSTVQVGPSYELELDDCRHFRFKFWLLPSAGAAVPLADRGTNCEEDIFCGAGVSV